MVKVEGGGRVGEGGENRVRSQSVVSRSGYHLHNRASFVRNFLLLLRLLRKEAISLRGRTVSLMSSSSVHALTILNGLVEIRVCRGN